MFLVVAAVDVYVHPAVVHFQHQRVQILVTKFCLVGWLDGWLVDWIVGWFDGWMVGWLDG
jgi:hypothetical protein